MSEGPWLAGGVLTCVRLCGDNEQNKRFLSFYHGDMNSSLQPPANPSHTIWGSRCVGGFSVDERASLLGGGSPHLLHKDTSTDDNRRFVIVAEFCGALWAVFLRWELRACNFGDKVACTSDAPMPLLHQCHELVVYSLWILCHGGWFQWIRRSMK